MVGEWRDMPFSEAVTVNPRVQLARGSEYPFVDMQAVGAGSRSVYATERRPFEGGGSRFAVGDTLMARITPCLENGKIARFCADPDAVAHGSTEFIVIRGRDAITETDYAYYLTKWDGVSGYAISQMTGTSGRQRVPTEALDHLLVPVPPLPEQRAIAHILGTLDDKIELNRRMNETLEAMARALFKSWFVDFDPVRAKAERRLPAGRQAAPPPARSGAWFVYAIECENGSIYIGHTEDVERRFDEHASGKGAEWTKRHPPRRIAYWEELPSQAAAVAREKKLKTGSGREWLKAEIARCDLASGGLPKPPCLPDRQVADLFPNSFEDSELGEIPKGWKVVPLPEAIEVNPTRSLRKGVAAPYLDMANMPTRVHSPDEVVLRSFGSGMRFINGDTLVARITPCLENGKTAFVDFLNEGQVGWGSTEYIVLRPKPPLPEEFAYCIARSAEFREFAIQSMTGSSGRQRVPAESLSHIRVVTAPRPIAELFGRLIKPLFARASAATKEGRALAALRDTLLPKLISGELLVPYQSAVAAKGPWHEKDQLT